MKTTLMIVAAVASAAFLVGCASPRGGGMSGGEGFTIGTPMFTTKVRQGETESVTVTVNRGKYFKRDVTLEIKASKGVTVEPLQAVVRGNETPDVHLRITAAKDADLGEYKIFIKGTPETGTATSTEIKVKVVSP